MLAADQTSRQVRDMMAELQAVVASIRAAVDIGKAAKSVSDFNNFGTAVADVNMKLMTVMAAANTAMEKQGQQNARIKELEEELVRVKAWDEQKRRYKLMSPWPGSGSMVYALREAASNGEPPHWICTSCYETGRRSILNPAIIPPSPGHHSRMGYSCPVCKSVVASPYTSAVAAGYALD
jgi:hypothetical protein